MEKCRGVRAKLPFSFLSPATKIGEGERAAPAALAGGPGWFGGCLGEGGKGEGGQEARFPTAARAEADRSGLATRDGGRRRCGGGTAGWGGGLAAVGEVLGVEVARFPSLP